MSPDDDVRGWPRTAEDLGAELAGCRLTEEQVAFLTERSRPALMLATTRVEDRDIPVGASKIGGCPDLPPGMAWPTRPAYPDGEDMAVSVLQRAEGALIAAGVAPPWMPAVKARKAIERHAREVAKMDAKMRREIDGLRRKLEKLEAKGPGREDEKELLRDYIERYGAGGEEDDDAEFSLSPEDAKAEGRRAMAQAEAVIGPFPLAFMAQFDLAELSGRPGFDPALPKEGRLYFFYDLLALPPSHDPESRIGFRVVFDASPAEALARSEMPAALARVADFYATVLAPARLTAAPAVTTMSLAIATRDGPKLAARQKDAYDEWLTDTVGWPVEIDTGHQLGGWPREIQAGMQEMAQLVANGVNAGDGNAWKGKKAKALLAEAGAWRLLFQLGADERIGNMLPGALNFLVREEDLAARRFDRAWAVYEQS